MNRDNGSPKRHCMVVYAHYPLGETRVQRQAEALIDAGFEVSVISLREKATNEPAEENVNGVHVHRVPLDRRKRNNVIRLLIDYIVFFIVATGTLTRLHLKHRYHIVQVHNLPDFLIFAGWFPKMLGTPIILDIHDLMPEFMISRSGGDMHSFKTRLMIWQEQLSCRFADHVITVTDIWRQTLIERGVPAEKVSVVMNVADNRIFQNHTKSSHKDPIDCFKLIYHGLQVERYGLDLLLQAVANLKNEIPNLHVLLHGNGEYHRTLKKIATELGINDRVTFSTAYMDVAQLPEFLGTADVGIVPYRRDIFTDGILPTKLMEYVALGIPIIAARTPIIERYFDSTMVEFITPDNLAELEASILKLYKDASLRQKLVQNANKFNETYSWAKTSKDYVNIVKDLHGSAPKR